jgi:hypothetical protein
MKERRRKEGEARREEKKRKGEKERKKKRRGKAEMQEGRKEELHFVSPGNVLRGASAKMCLFKLHTKGREGKGREGKGRGEKGDRRGEKGRGRKGKGGGGKGREVKESQGRTEAKLYTHEKK